MAALFSPEGEKLRAAQKDKALGSTAALSAVRVPGGTNVGGSGKSNDSLGNPNSPGYDPLNLNKKKKEEEAQQQTKAGKGPTLHGYEAKDLGPQYIRLGMGWEKVLMTQKKLCEKAKGLFTLLEGPLRYRGQKKSSLLEEKSRGSILDLDVEKERERVDLEKKEAEKKESA